MEVRILIKKVVSDNERAPQGEVIAWIDNVEYTGGVWTCTDRDNNDAVKLDKNNNPMLYGKLKLKEVKHDNPRNNPNPTFF